MTMAYHAERMPAELERAEYHVSSNIGRTIHASRQSVIDARACLDWLGQQGYSRVGILGTSLGSCVAFIAAAHDPRVRVGIFNHVSMYFSDVVWTGLSTHTCAGAFGDVVSQDDLRRYWARDQSGILSEALSRPRHAKPARLGAPRYQLPAGLFPTGSTELPGIEAGTPGFPLCPAATTHGAVSVQGHGWASDVPFSPSGTCNPNIALWLLRFSRNRIDKAEAP